MPERQFIPPRPGCESALLVRQVPIVKVELIRPGITAIEVVDGDVGGLLRFVLPATQLDPGSPLVAEVQIETNPHTDSKPQPVIPFGAIALD